MTRPSRWTIVLVLTSSLLGAAPVVAQPAPSPDAAPAARRFRDFTEHSPESVRVRRHPLVWQNKPTLYRSYEGAPTVPLPPPPRLERPALEVIARSVAVPEDRAAQLDLPRLSAVLFLSGGIVDRLANGRRDIRATAAAGALYPNETYVVSGQLPGLAAGVYHYDPQRNVLSQLRSGDWRPVLAAAAADARIRGAPVTLVLTGILWRSAWKYEERGYRHLYWDGGMKLAHVLAAATAAELPATVLAGFIDAEVDRLLGIDGRKEMSLALVPLGSAQPNLPSNAEGKEASPAPSVPPAVSPPPIQFVPTVLSPRPIDYPAALSYHAAAALADSAAVERYRRGAPAIRPPWMTPAPRTSLPDPASARGDPSLDAASLDAASLDAVVRRRRSTRRFAPRPIRLDELATVLELPAAGAPADFLAARPSLIETYVIVNAVRGLEAGAYHYDRSRRELERLKTGGLRGTAGFLCLGQELARDASAVIYYLANLDAVGAAFGERGYRTAELEAGLVAGRAYLAAYAIGRGATGLTFYDEEVTRFFSPHGIGWEPLLVVAVGVPAKR